MFKDILEKSIILIICLTMAVVGLLIYNFQIFNLPSITRYIVSSTLIIGALFLLVENIIYQINTKIERDSLKLSKGMENLHSNISSTVKTLQFFSEGDEGEEVRSVRMSTEPLRTVRDVVVGNVNFRLINHFLGTETTVILIEARADSKFNPHSHEQVVDFYVVRGSVKQHISDREISLTKGESVKIDTGIEREFRFEEDSVIVMTFTPALDDWVEGKMEVGKYDS